MADNYGKKFEAQLKQDWLKVTHSDITRLYDPTSGYKKISNISDFVGYIYPFMFYLEAKTTKENTFSLKKLTQADKLKEKQGIPGVNPGVVIWFRKHKKVCYVPIEEYVRLEQLKYKSVNVKMIGDPNFNVYEIPGTLKRTFIDSDYSIMKDIAQQKFNKMIGD